MSSTDNSSRVQISSLVGDNQSYTGNVGIDPGTTENFQTQVNLNDADDNQDCRITPSRNFVLSGRNGHGIDSEELSSTDRGDGQLEAGQKTRRVFDDRLDIMLVEEVMRNGVHKSTKGSWTRGYEKVARVLNDSGRLPWTTDGKHCDDRIVLITRNHKNREKRRVRRKGSDLKLFNLSAKMLKEKKECEERLAEQKRLQAERATQRSMFASELRDRAMHRASHVVDLVSSDEQDGSGTAREIMGSGFSTPTRESVVLNESLTPSREPSSRDTLRSTPVDANERAILALETNERNSQARAERAEARDRSRLEMERERHVENMRNTNRRLSLDERQVGIQERMLELQEKREEREAEARERMDKMHYQMMELVQSSMEIRKNRE